MAAYVADAWGAGRGAVRHPRHGRAGCALTAVATPSAAGGTPSSLLQVFEQRVRKHHCRCCGRVFCKWCSRERAAIPRLNLNSPVRVCDSCSLLLLPGNPANPFPGSTSAGAAADGSDDDGDDTDSRSGVGKSRR